MKKIYFLLIAVFMMSLQLNAQSYCTDGGPDFETDSNVESVDLVGENQSISYTGCQNGGNGVAGVEDLTSSQVADLVAGNTYTIDVQFGTCGGNFSGAGEVWIDFNQDFTFDSSESIGTLTSGSPPFSLSSFTFTVPSGAVNGNTRLRVMQEEGGALPLNPCEDFQWGSVTDFGIDISGGTVVTCPKPLNLTATNAGDVSVDLSWDEEPNASNGYIYEIYNAGDVQGTDTPVVSGTVAFGTNSVTAMGLTADTSYEAYVISDCGAQDGLSDANGPVPFTTNTCPAADQCGYVFELTDTFGDGWNGGTMDVLQNGNVIATLGSNFTNGNSTTETIQICTNSNIELFWDQAGTFPTEIGVIITDPFGEVVYTLSPGNDQSGTTLTTFTSDCTPPSCLKPENLSVSNIMASEATFSWDEEPNASNGYIWELFDAGADPENDAPVQNGTVAFGTNTVTVTGLTQNSDYDFYLQSDCGTQDGVSDPTDALTFSTPCTIFTAP